jgi:catechol 2,3-dioxygenase-like lactoylglutathione lyase family enzyme
MKFVCPLITVSDINRSRVFYENVLGQKVKFNFGENITFHGDFAIHLDTHFSKLIDNKSIQKGSNSFELYFEDNDIEILSDKLKAHKVEFVHPLREQTWKQLVVRFYDPDYNIIEVGEPMEKLVLRLHKMGFTFQEIQKQTGLEQSFIVKTLEK